MSQVTSGSEIGCRKPLRHHCSCGPATGAPLVGDAVRARNVGARISSAEVVAYVDDDCLVAEGGWRHW